MINKTKYNFLFLSGHLRKSWVDVDEEVIRRRRQGKKEGRMFQIEGAKRQI